MFADYQKENEYAIWIQLKIRIFEDSIRLKNII